MTQNMKYDPKNENKTPKFENLQIVGTPLPPLLESTIRRNHPDHTNHPGENPRSLSSPKTKKKKKKNFKI